MPYPGSGMPAGSAPLRLTGNRKNDNKAYAGYAAGQLPGLQGETDAVTRMLFASLGSPGASANAYLPFFTNAANAAAAPALRDFLKTQTSLQANVASRFGGKVSSEESRITGNSADMFSRNLTEALARVGPQAVAAGQNRDNMLLGFRGQLGGESADLQRRLLAAINGEPEGTNWGKIIGTVAGTAAAALL